MSKFGTHSHYQSGVALMEVLIAILVLAIGLLGVAGLQSASLRNAAEVHYEQEAQSYGDELLNRIMANTSAANDGAYEATPPTAAPSPNCSNAVCTDVQIAQWDLWQWSNGLLNATGAPPGAALDVNWVPAREEYQVAITWDAYGDGDDYTAPTCTVADNTSRGCFFTVYRLRSE